MSGAKHWYRDESIPEMKTKGYSLTSHREQDKDSTVYVGNLAEQTTDAIIWELMIQAGPVVNVHLPKDRVTQTHQGYGFVEFASEEDADYAVKIMNQIRLWGKPIRVNKASADKRGGGTEGSGLGGGAGVGAELFVGNLDSMVEEKMLFETFSRFGALVAPPKVARDDSNISKGYGFISYASFEASDDAIEHMHGQFLMNKEITVQYAFKKDGKGERHGDAAERALAAQAKKNNVEIAIPAMPASLVMPNNAPTAPAAMGAPRGPPSAPPTPYGGFPPGGFQPPPVAPYGFPPAGPRPGPSPQAMGGYGPPPMGHPGMPPNMPPNMPHRQFNQSPLHAPPAAGLPPRPPPSAAGYGGPPQPPMMGYQGGMPGMPPPGGPPSGMPGPPPGFPPGFPPQPPQHPR